MVGLEEGMLLDCLCPWNGTLSMVSWTKSPDRTTPIAVFHPHFGKTFSWRYRQRVEFPRSPQSVAPYSSLLLVVAESFRLNCTHISCSGI